MEMRNLTKLVLLIILLNGLFFCAVLEEKPVIEAEEKASSNIEDRPESVIKAFGREYTELFYNGSLEELSAHFSDEMLKALPLDAFITFREQVINQLGVEIELESEEINQDRAFYLYIRIYRAAKYNGRILAQWVIDPKGTIHGFYISPIPVEAENPNLDYVTKSHLILPFKGTWSVFWGGRSIEDNYHAAYMDQRFAYDFLIMKDDSSHKNDGALNTDYYCFGEELFAPADGIVYATEKSIRDNTPGIMNADQPLGNFIIIDHENGEYSFMAHFKQDSILVKAGDRINRGEFLGLCGNSGNSSEAHLHYHLQDTPFFGNGMGLPAFFNDYFADGSFIARGEPVKGQLISQK